MRILILLFLIVTSHIQAQRTKITASRLFDGTTMQKDWGVVVEGNAIVEVGPINRLGPADQVMDFPNGTIMPGMIEGHSHVLLYPYNEMGWNDQVLKESRSLRAIRGAKMATKNLYAGFTTIRDLGSEGAGYADVAIKQSIEQGIIEGPRMLVAGRAIVATGSYGPKGFHPDFNVPLGAEPADGQQLITVTRDQIGKGADFIKVYADYRWGPDKAAMPTFSIEEMKLIVETAASSGRDVVAHAATAEGMRRAALAGVKTIEHGSAATPEVLELMKEKGVALCPTLAATHSVTQYFDGWNGQDPEPERILNKRQMMKEALKSGVTIVAGGDVGVFPHGENVKELELMVDYGMSEIDVLTSVTSVNAQVFGLAQLGILKEGFLADIIVVSGDPVQNISNLRKVEMVMKDGKKYK
ncbi:amidohydrolase family protein [Ekhidna sp. To15]|uniref:metal-dependent hydrolase family protein n=1 Tax=Ekhidna sp. To15 TaxID=3395267 RepID=UPI003F525F73